MTSDQQRIIDISEALREGAKRISILRNIAWPNEVEQEFFKNNAEKLPVVEYQPYDPEPVLSAVKNAQSLLTTNDEIDKWAHRIASKLESSALLLANRGKKEFYEHSKNMYGYPKEKLGDGVTTPLDLANHFGKLFEHAKDFDLGKPPELCVLPSTLAAEMKKAVDKMFGDKGPEILMDDKISSKAIAGRRRIAIHPEACFTDKNIQQLVEHEVYIHVATSLNGRAQKNIKVLRYAHAGTTETQEGLAVLSEFMTGCIDLERTRRLSDRVTATQMAIDGANFIDVYRYFLEITDDPGKSYDATRRVFRGGVIEGGAPFTKDIVYIEGLIRVQNFLSIIISTGKFEYIDLLFCGKLSILDIPALKQMDEMGLIDHPPYLPEWIRDKRFLLTHMTYLSFLRDIDGDKLHDHYERLIR